MRFSACCFFVVAALGVVAGCGGRDIGQVPSTGGAASYAGIPKPKATPTPYLVQELFASRNVTSEDGVVALAPPHGKPTFVDPSFFPSGGGEPLLANTSGDLFAATGCSGSSASVGCVAEFASPYTKAPINITTDGLGDDPVCYGFECMALDSQQNLYVVQWTNDQYEQYVVNEYASPYNGAPTALLVPPKSFKVIFNAGVVTYGSDMFTLLSVCDIKASQGCNNWASYVNEYSSPPKWGKQIAQVSVGGIDGCQKGFAVYPCDPYAAVVDASGNLFVSWGSCGCGNGSGGLVTEWAPPYKGKPKVVISKDVEQPNSIALNTKGDLFVLNDGSVIGSPSRNNVTEYAPPYTGSPTIISKGIGGQDDLANLVVDSAGNLFVADYGQGGGGGAILEYEPPYTGSPIEITAGLGDFAPIYLALDPSSSK